VEGVFPGLVHVEGAATRRSTTRGLIAPLIEAVKELDTRIAAFDAAGDTMRSNPGSPLAGALWGDRRQRLSRHRLTLSTIVGIPCLRLSEFARW
jgi:hypothetical protein